MMPSHQQAGDAPDVQSPMENGTGPVMLSNTAPGQQDGVALGDIDSFKSGVQANEKKRYGLSDTHPQQADGSFQVGGMDVTFDPNTDPEAAKRFLEDPVRPTAAINRGQTFNAPGPEALSQAGPEIKEPELISYETNPNMDWRQAAAINETRTRGYEAQKLAAGNNASDEEIANLMSKTKLAEQGMKQDGKNFRLDDLNKFTTKRDKIMAGFDEEHDERVAASSLATAGARGPAGAKSKYIEPKFDKKNNRRPGTGRWVHPPINGIDFNVSADFDPANGKTSKSDRGKLEALALLANSGNGAAADQLLRIEQEYGLQP